MIHVAEIRSMLQQLILAEMSLEAFDSWLAKASWNMHLDSDSDAIQLVGALQSLLAELDAGHVSSDDFHQEIKDLAGLYVFGDSSNVVASGSITHPLLFGKSESAGKRFSMEFLCTPLPQV